ncbi:M1 family metallopeptidase [uncultured Aquimarina sp.]|uniref:M1 family metallopeptidase n=1 Tax=uncultured Aquimarina sp. TaxID=575652 RepID=UPI0026351473|nr:M1 family metallopeptidase [uncultured Aquimarina sp.]
MIRPKIISVLLTLCTISIVYSQSNLHIPREIQKAYKNQTRSVDGKPGKKYWQNSVDYKINVRVFPETRIVEGNEIVNFTNNSPDELSEMVIRLYYDVFKKGNKRDSRVNPKDIGEGVELKTIIVDGVNYDLANSDNIKRYGTNLTVRLREPLKSGQDLKLEFEWQQKVTLTLDRTGAKDDTSFFVGYWYPQVSVYDDIFGWDRLDYTLDTEFYNNLSDFDVNITVPDNFLVWATGTLENGEKVLPNNIYKKFLKAKESKEVIEVVNEKDLEGLKLKYNTWNFTAKEVTDFAFAMSDHYLWHAASVNVAGKDILINSAFPKDEVEKHKKLTSIQQKAMKHFSEDVPGIPYPYPVFSTFIGLRYSGSGMEFPMMANNGGSGVPVTVHELFHMYFPMYVRINERRFAWMDEGWADFMENLVIHKFFNEDKSNSFYSRFKLVTQGTLGTIGDLPTVTSSQYTGDSYGYQAYSLPSLTYALLYQYLGEEKFFKCFNSYVKRWAKKSPTPYDFFNTFENVSGEDLSFFWKPWYFEMGYPDVGIKSFDEGKLIVEKVGYKPIPISIDVVYKNSKKSYSKIIDFSVWKNDNRTYAIPIPNHDQVESIVLNSDFPDFNETDNFFPPLKDSYEEKGVKSSIVGNYYVEDYNIELSIAKENEALVIYSNSWVWLNTILIPKDSVNFNTSDKTGVLKYLEDVSGRDEIELEYPKYNLKLKGIKK